MSWRRVAATTALSIAGALAGSCASDPADELPHAIHVVIGDRGEDAVTMRATRAVAAGVVQIELRNEGDVRHDAQLFRVTDQTSADIIDALEEGDSSPKPRWLHPAGGLAPIDPGERATVTQVLSPGTYYVADTQERSVASGARLTNAAKGGIARIEVRGEEAGGELPATLATIEARDYGYDVEGIAPGANLVTFRNVGRQMHQAVAVRIDDSGPFAAARRRALERRPYMAWAPVSVPAERATTVLSAGEEQVTEMTFRPGRYALLCFMSDRAGGAPQWTFGMVAELRVSERAAARRPAASPRRR